MAGNHAPIHHTIWREDDEFRSLTMAAQHLYFLVISQPDVSWCGVLPYLPKRWASYAVDLDLEAIAANLDELVAAGFLFLDDITEELWIKGFVKHRSVLGQPTLMKAMGRAFKEVASASIRRRIYDALPADKRGFLGTPPDTPTDTPPGTPSEGYTSGYPIPQARTPVLSVKGLCSEGFGLVVKNNSPSELTSAREAGESFSKEDSRRSVLADRYLSACDPKANVPRGPVLEVIDGLLAEVDWLIVDEAIGICLMGTEKPQTAKYLDTAARAHAADRGVRLAGAESKDPYDDMQAAAWKIMNPCPACYDGWVEAEAGVVCCDVCQGSGVAADVA